MQVQCHAVGREDEEFLKFQKRCIQPFLSFLYCFEYVWPSYEISWALHQLFLQKEMHIHDVLCFLNSCTLDLYSSSKSLLQLHVLMDLAPPKVGKRNLLNILSTPRWFLQSMVIHNLFIIKINKK